MSLTGKSPADTYKDLAYVDNSNSGVDSTLRSVKTGEGSTTAVSLSDRALKVKSATDNTTALDANKHYSVPFQGNNHSLSVQNDFDFGTGTDPATTFTTADATATHSSTIVPVMWFVPDNISIDGVYSIEGADDGTGDTSRMHLFSYTFTSGSTSTQVVNKHIQEVGQLIVQVYQLIKLY